MGEPYIEPVRRKASGRNHFYVDGNDQKIPGVTTIIKGFMPTPALTRWAANTTAAWAIDHWDELAAKTPSVRLEELRQSPWIIRDAAALRGTQIHELADKLSHGEEVAVPETEAGHVDAAVAFLDEWQVEPILTEVCVYHLGNGHAGTLDLVARLSDGLTYLLDYKSGKGVYADAALQLSAYRFSESWVPLTGGDPQPMPEVDRCGIVHIRADGYSLYPVDAGPETYKVFRHGQVVARWNETQDKARRGTGGAVGVIGDVIRPEAVA